MWVDGAQSFRSCVKYYPSAGTEVITLNIVSSGGTEEAGCLVGLKSIV